MPTTVDAILDAILNPDSEGMVTAITENGQVIRFESLRFYLEWTEERPEYARQEAEAANAR